MPLSKFPEDLRVYEHLLWEDARRTTLIEIGTQSGGSALWFRDRLRTNPPGTAGLRASRAVIMVDVKHGETREGAQGAEPDWTESISLVEGDVRDPPHGGRCREAESPTAHAASPSRTMRTSMTPRLAALEGFARFVPPGGFFVVEDGCVDMEELRLDPGWPRGVLPALHEMAHDRRPGQAFRVRRDLELFGVSCHPEGFPRRT